MPELATHQEAYDEPDISHESPERVNEAQQVLEDEGGRSDEAQYVREKTASQIIELGTLFNDFTAATAAAAGDGPSFEPGTHALQVR